MATPNTNIVVTVIPAGKAGALGNKRRFSVHIAPRLRNDEVLAAFPLFVEWATVALKAFGEIKLRRLGTAASSYNELGTVVGKRISDDPEPELWERLFPNPADVAVDPFSTKTFGDRFKKSKFHSYPTLALHDFHAKFFTGLAIANETNPPTPATLETALGSLTRVNVRDDVLRVQKFIDSAFSQGDNTDWSKVLPPGPTRPRAGTSDQTLADHLQFVRFLQPRTDPKYILDNPVVQQPRIDFHRVISLLADHPYVQRMLGLVMDYEIDAPAVSEAGSFSNTSFLQVDPEYWAEIDAVLAFPRTRLEPKSFRAMVRSGSALSDAGVANLSSAYSAKTGFGWALTSLDVEGTAAKAIGLADTVQRNQASTSSPENKPASLDVPAPRSGGLSLVRAGRSVEVVAAFKRTSELLEGTAPGASVPTPMGPVSAAAPVIPGAAAEPTGDGVEVWAEDLIRGWRVDVFDNVTGVWRSLTRRDTDYKFSATGSGYGLTVDDDTVMGSAPGEARLFLNEGVVSLGVTASADPTKTAADTFVQESVLEWTGWSLVAPRPGKTLGASGNRPVSQDEPYNSDLDLQIVVEPTPSSLPRLRYGHRYRVRLRSANLAGNGPTLEEVGASSPTAGTPTRDAAYSRFEPVPAPAVAQYDSLATGEALMNLVIKSEDETSPLSAAGKKQRHVLPPAAGAHTVELHGMLDTMLPGDAYSLLSFREGQQLENAPAPVWQTMMPYTPYVTPTADPGSGDQETPVFNGEVRQPPWLVDPAAVGVRIEGPEMGARSSTYSRGPLGWADAQTSRLVFSGLGVNVPSRLTLISPTASDSWRTPRFLVEVAKGEQFTIRMSSTVNRGLRDHFGIVQLLKDRLPLPPSLPARLVRVERGQNRLVSPPTELTVVHAVRKPLLAPYLLVGTAVAARSLGDTFALMGGRVACHPQSTSRIDFTLSWSEWHDKPGDYVPDTTTPSDPDDTTDRPRRVEGSGVALPLSVAYPAPGVRPKFVGASGLRHDFGDTKHRYVRVSLSGTSRYAKYFTEDDTRVLSSYTTVFGSAAVQPLSERIVDRASGQVLQRDVDYTIDYTNHRFTLTAVGGPKYSTKTVYITWVPANVTRKSLPSNDRMVHVRSSARPAAPVVKDVFPLYVDGDWTLVGKPPFATGQRRTRNGHALRVYLDRPWYSSGDDEMLAVVLHRVPMKLGKGSSGAVAEPTMLAPQSPSDPGGNVPKSVPQQYTTAWGRDPLVIGQPAPARLSASSFPLGASAPLFGKWVSGLKLPGTNTSVVVVPHNVEYDEDLKLWYSDIQIDLGSAYRPFVRLALARLQPYSLDGCHLSEVVLLDSAQLSPTRTLQVFGSGPTRSVTITGPMYSATSTGTPRAVLGLDAPVPELRMAPLFEVTVQEREAFYLGLDDSENLGWTDIVDGPSAERKYVLGPAAGNVRNGAGKYSVANVNVSATVVGRQVRLVVREFERDSRLLSEVLDTGDAFRKRLAWVDSYVIP